jgi:hypothetical protein
MKSYRAKATGMRGLTNFTEGKTYEITPIMAVSRGDAVAAVDDGGNLAYVHAHRFTRETTEQTTYDTEQAKVWFSEGHSVLIAHPDGPDSEPITGTSEIDDAVGHLFVMTLSRLNK